MLYSQNIKKAINIAFKAHEGQYDKGGYPYIMHPLHLAEEMTTENEVITALLHDVLEDSEISLDFIKEQGFSEDVTNALVSLTRRKDEEYSEYIKRIKNTGGIALSVKKADLQHNMTLGRLENLTEKDKERLIKYKVSYKELTEE